MQVVDNWFDYHTLADQGIPVRHISEAPPQQVVAPPPPPPPPPVEEDDNVSWIEDIYDTVDAATGGILPGGVPFGTSLPQHAVTQFSQTAPIPTAPAPVSAPVAAPQGCSTDNMVYKKVCGQWKWVKKRKPRRKRLATASDIKDLTALKGVLGNGQALQSWIATH